MTDAPTPGGRIVLVGTPIGNLGDLSDRARQMLAGADVICCEDTRRTRALLSASGIPAGDRLVAMHAHNELGSAQQAVARALRGATVAVVTDAGMPGVSDPGEAVVVAAVAAGVEVDVVPGAAAAVAALVVSGLPTGRWAFEGFLPRSGGERKQRLAAVAADERTTVLYEAPHRVARTLAELREACGGDRAVAFARELTKVHQELWRGTLGEAVSHVAAEAPRGEWVVVLGGAAPPASRGADEVLDALGAAAEAGFDRRSAVRQVTAALGVSRKVVYAAALGLPWPERGQQAEQARRQGSGNVTVMPGPAGGYDRGITKGSTMQITHTLQLPSDVESVPLVRGLIRVSMVQLGVEESCVADIALAVTEACANVISHARGGGGDYEVRVEIDPDDCHIRVIDTGAGFDAGAVALSGGFAESGRGVALMRALVDELHFTPREQQPGTIVHLTKHLDLKADSPLRGLVKG